MRVLYTANPTFKHIVYEYNKIQDTGAWEGSTLLSMSQSQPNDAKSRASDQSEDQDVQDETLLLQNGHDIEKLLKLIEKKASQSEAEKLLSEAQSYVDARKQGTVFHQDMKGKRRIALNHHTSNLIKLSDALELSLTTLNYGDDLHKELDTCLEKRIEVLKRIKKRRTDQTPSKKVE